LEEEFFTASMKLKEEREKRQLVESDFLQLKSSLNECTKMLNEQKEAADILLSKQIQLLQSSDSQKEELERKLEAMTLVVMDKVAECNALQEKMKVKHEREQRDLKEKEEELSNLKRQYQDLSDLWSSGKQECLRLGEEVDRWKEECQLAKQKHLYLITDPKDKGSLPQSSQSAEETNNLKTSTKIANHKSNGIHMNMKTDSFAKWCSAVAGSLEMKLAMESKHLKDDMKLTIESLQEENLTLRDTNQKLREERKLLEVEIERLRDAMNRQVTERMLIDVVMKEKEDLRTTELKNHQEDRNKLTRGYLQEKRKTESEKAELGQKLKSMEEELQMVKEEHQKTLNELKLKETEKDSLVEENFVLQQEKKNLLQELEAREGLHLKITEEHQRLFNQCYEDRNAKQPNSAPTEQNPLPAQVIQSQ